MRVIPRASARGILGVPVEGLGISAAAGRSRVVSPESPVVGPRFSAGSAPVTSQRERGLKLITKTKDWHTWNSPTAAGWPAISRHTKALYQDDEDSSLTSLALLRAGTSFGMT